MNKINAVKVVSTEEEKRGKHRNRREHGDICCSEGCLDIVGTLRRCGDFNSTRITREVQPSELSQKSQKGLMKIENKRQ